MGTTTMPCCCVGLEENQQALFTSITGVRSVTAGPGCIPYNCFCTSFEKRPALQVESGRYAFILNDENSERRAVHGPCVEWLGPREQLITPGIQDCPSLTREEYVVVHDTLSGAKRLEIGPKLLQPGPFDEVAGKTRALNLAKHEYVKIKDEHGKLRIERGEARIIPQPLEEVQGGVKKAINIDEHHAVMLRNADTGTIELITEHGLFIPGPYQENLQVVDKIILEEYERMAYKDETGKFHFVSGDSPMRNFFLPPFCEILKQQWSTDLRKEHMECEEVWRFDMRPSYMNYEFNCRTIDNVELVVDVSLYCQISKTLQTTSCTMLRSGQPTLLWLCLQPSELTRSMRNEECSCFLWRYCSSAAVTLAQTRPCRRSLKRLLIVLRRRNARKATTRLHYRSLRVRSSKRSSTNN